MLKRIVGGVGGLVIVLVVVALKFGAGWGIGFLGAKADAPDVGKCVTLSGSSTDANADEATCGADGVLYKVVSDNGSCDDTELSYTISVTGKDAADLCLAWDVEAGDCVKINGINDPDEKVACSPATDGSTVVKITAVLDSAGGQCPKGSQGVANKTRDTKLCAVAVS
ncbi:LppU/SCO3897 family protein [Nocardioides panacisoli]|uniref:Uncharacterized protein n=1 Tax=Nocardioides panacisoli TaxID=627624 RepID=A0ABP7IWS1_9ACTN